MVKKFAIPCNFSGNVVNVDFFIGKPHKDSHPMAFQAKWLSSEKGGEVPQKMMDSIAKIKKIADENNIDFEEMCVYAINLANGRITEENAEFNRLFIEYDKKFANEVK